MKNRHFDEYGSVYLTQEDIFNILYDGDTNLSGIPAQMTEDLKQYNYFCNLFDQQDQTLEEYTKPRLTIQEYDKQNQKQWFIPKEYQNIDIESFVLSKCKSKSETSRATQELNLFHKYEMFDVLKFMIYFVDECRKHNFVRGVGRGSSVGSFVLYLVGIHKIDPIKFNIPYTDFFKEELDET